MPSLSSSSSTRPLQESYSPLTRRPSFSTSSVRLSNVHGAALHSRTTTGGSVGLLLLDTHRAAVIIILPSRSGNDRTNTNRRLSFYACITVAPCLSIEYAVGISLGIPDGYRAVAQELSVPNLYTVRPTRGVPPLPISTALHQCLLGLVPSAGYCCYEGGQVAATRYCRRLQRCVEPPVVVCFYSESTWHFWIS